MQIELQTEKGKTALCMARLFQALYDSKEIRDGELSLRDGSRDVFTFCVLYRNVNYGYLIYTEEGYQRDKREFIDCLICVDCEHEYVYGIGFDAKCKFSDL